MNTIDAMKARKSIRGFKPDPVDRITIQKILEAAVRAPSAMNTQPWEFYVITGDPLHRMRKQIVEKLNAGAPMQPDHHVTGWPRDSIYRDRQVRLAKQLFNLMEIGREDKQKRAQWLERGFRFFDAPVAIIVAADKMLSESGPLFDIGAVVNNICLAALEFDLGTCIEDQGVLYPEVPREVAKIPNTKRLMIAIALGYPDPDFPANQVESDRVPVDEITTWIGF